MLASRGEIRPDMSEPGHHDGWGLVSYLKENVPEYIEREPESLTENAELFEKAAKWAESSGYRTTMLHIRKSTDASKSIANTHPFVYKEWSFCHNGTIFDSEKIRLKKLKPSGQTDSERFFLYLMEQMKWPFKPESRIRKAAAYVRKHFKYTSLTFLLTNGKKLYAYRDCDPKYQDYYTLYTAQVNGAKIVSSEPLPSLSRDWTSLRNGELLRLD